MGRPTLSGRPVVAMLALACIAAAVLIGRQGLRSVASCGPVDDPYPSRTAADWKAGADHVVVALPTAERETNREDFDKGSVRYTVDRAVTFRKAKVLWSADTPGMRWGARST